ncbi:MAG: hypothetical protein ACK53T_05550 [Planctomycetota bacterium]
MSARTTDDAAVPPGYTAGLRRDYRRAIATSLQRLAARTGYPAPACPWCQAPPCDGVICSEMRHPEGQP